jgi:hypothetical protein
MSGDMGQRIYLNRAVGCCSVRARATFNIARGGIPSGEKINAENESKAYLKDFKSLLKGRYSLGYVLSQNIPMFMGDTPDEVLEKIQRIGEEDSGNDAMNDTETYDTAAAEEEGFIEGVPSEMKAAYCGTRALHDCGSKGAKVCSVWFEDDPAPEKVGKRERFHAKVTIMNTLTRKKEVIPVEVLVVRNPFRQVERSRPEGPPVLG